MISEHFPVQYLLDYECWEWYSVILLLGVLDKKKLTFIFYMRAIDSQALWLAW